MWKFEVIQKFLDIAQIAFLNHYIQNNQNIKKASNRVPFRANYLLFFKILYVEIGEILLPTLKIDDRKKLK